MTRKARRPEVPPFPSSASAPGAFRDNAAGSSSRERLPSREEEFRAAIQDAMENVLNRIDALLLKNGPAESGAEQTAGKPLSVLDVAFANVGTFAYEDRWALVGSLSAAPSTSTLLLTPGNAVAIPFSVVQTTTFDGVAFEHTSGGGASAQAKVLVYDDTGALYPGDVVFESAWISTPSSGFTVYRSDTGTSFTLDVGKVYWAVFFYPSDAGSSITVTSLTRADAPGLLGGEDNSGVPQANNAEFAWRDTGAGTSPDDPFASGASPNLAPLLFLRAT